MVNNASKLPELLSTKQVAKLLGISREAIHKRIKKGKIKAHKVGRNYVVPRDSLGIISDRSLSENQRLLINSAVKLVVQEYGDALRLLGKE